MPCKMLSVLTFMPSKLGRPSLFVYLCKIVSLLDVSFVMDDQFQSCIRFGYLVFAAIVLSSFRSSILLRTLWPLVSLLGFIVYC